MNQQRLRRSFRQSGILEARRPPALIRQEQAVGQVVDPTGALIPDAIKPFLPPVRYRLHVPGALATGNAGGFDQVVRAGTIVRFRAHVGTAPTGAACIVQLRDAAANVLATVTIPAGQTTAASDGLTMSVNGGTWIGLHITQTGGAANLSAVVIEEVR
jgi:hypothetical protein